jgi:HAMP domain-containing protein
MFGCRRRWLFMWVVVYRPVKELIDGMHRVARAIWITGCRCAPDDELGDLAPPSIK